MSAFLSVRKATSIEVLCDAGIYDSRDGSILSIASKIHQPPGIVGVVVGVGEIMQPRAIAVAASAVCRDFDEVVAGFTEVLAWVDTSIAREVAPLNEHYFRAELLIAGWSAARDRPETYYLVRHKTDPVLAETFNTLSLTTPFFGRGPTVPAGLALVQRDPESIDLATDGLAVIEAMRASKEPLPPFFQFEGYGVGGFAELATITQLAVERRIVRRWPDEVGRPIRGEGHD